METTKVRLKEPYWGAGKRFIWDHAYDDKCGFGIDNKLLEGDGDLVIHLGPKDKWGVYTIPKSKARGECDFWDSFMTIKSTKLAVIPRHCCERIK